MDATTEARMNELIDELHAMVPDPENMAQQMKRRGEIFDELEQLRGKPLWRK
jgi:hypothetical protein